MAEQRTTAQRERQGVVVSDKMDKTIVVQVSAVKPHAEYKKVIRTTDRLKAHDEQNEARVGRHRAGARVPAAFPRQDLAPDQGARTRRVARRQEMGEKR